METMRRNNIKIIQTQIQDVPEIRVSTAGIWYPPEYHSPHGRFQYETWCFSDDNRQQSFQIIHGSDKDICFYCLRKAIKIHRYVSNNLKSIYGRNQ